MDYVQETDNIGSPREISQDLNLTLNFPLRDWFQDFDDASLFIGRVYAFENLVFSSVDHFLRTRETHFRVSSTPNSSNYLIVVRDIPVNSQAF